MTRKIIRSFIREVQLDEREKKRDARSFNNGVGQKRWG